MDCNLKKQCLSSNLFFYFAMCHGFRPLFAIRKTAIDVYIEAQWKNQHN